MHDATGKMQESFGDVLNAPFNVHDLIYADDTLLIDRSSETVQRYMDVVISTGAEYGLEINWQKVDTFGRRRQPNVPISSGDHIKQKYSI